MQNKLGRAAISGLSSSVTDVEKEILQSLRELEHAVAAMRTAASPPNLLPIFARIDDLTRRLPKDADPELLHFLHKKSYEKARAWLQARL